MATIDYGLNFKACFLLVSYSAKADEWVNDGKWPLSN